MADWISRKDFEFAALSKRWETVIKTPANLTSFKWDETEVGDLLIRIRDFLKAWDAFQESDSTRNCTAKNNTKKIAVKSMREFAASSVRFNRLIDTETKQEMGIPERDMTKTPSPPPKDIPVTVVENTVNHYQHKVLARNPYSQSSRKPEGVAGVTFTCRVGGERPASGKELPAGQFSHSTSMIFTHGEENRGKTVYYSTRYENSKGEHGEWSPIEEAIIA